MSYNVDIDVLDHLVEEVGLEVLALDHETRSALLVFGDDDGEQVGIAAPATYFEGPWTVDYVDDAWETTGEWTPPEEVADE